MGHLLLNLRNVPEDEYIEVKALLDEHAIPYYETEPSRWMVSFGGIWLADVSRIEEAEQLLADYQAERAEKARVAQDEALARGQIETPGQRYRHNPLAFIGALIGIGAILYLALAPFLTL
ncbi:DUF6164 family protein [Salicola sp. Rm-C-2C1-2]|uniref:DUF6164 family protein n=1 Tax=Salicola sp. Rm-C-2C1-2 TaxID=3141321 RepID=UPI0032E4E9BE